MKKLTVVLFVALSVILGVGAALADDAEFQLVVTRNDMSIGGEFDVVLQMQIKTGSTTPRTLNSLTADIYYTSTLTQWTDDPSSNWGPDWLKGYTTSADRLSGYYRVMVVGGNVGSGKGSGWNVTTTWQDVVTLKWTINSTSSVNLTIADPPSNAAAYFDNIGNIPAGDVTSWTVSNTDLGDVSLPVQMAEMKATASPREGIVLTWYTESEANSLGFKVWRSDRESGKYAQITTILIPSHGNSSARNEYTFADPNIQDGQTYWYKIEEISADGKSVFNGPISVQGLDMIPNKFALSQNYPNPFNPVTSLSYDLPEDSKTTIRIYTMLGKEVKTLVDKQMPAGRHTLEWDGTDNQNRKVSSGIYFLQMQAEGFSSVRKMTFLR
jgi:hypothetical protein